MQGLRLLFSKTGDAKFLSHLDLNRSFTRAVRRGGLEAWYTEGFHSHLYLLFALPLALGIESVCETVDLKFRALPEDPDVGERINPFLPEGLRVFNVLPGKYKVSSIARARYFAELKKTPEDAKRFAAAAEEVCGRAEIGVEKKGKDGVSVIDIKSRIHECSACALDGSCHINLLLDAGNEKSLNPMLLLSEIIKSAGCEPDVWNIRRLQILTNDGQNFE